VAGRGRDIDGPVAGAADIGAAALLQRLIGADPLAARVMVLPAGRADLLAKLVIEALGREVPLLLGDPFLQSKMRLYDEFAHGFPPSGGGFRRRD